MKPGNPARFNLLIKRSSALLIGLLIWVSMQGQVNSAYSILVAGHAYGAHAGTNIGLHPPFLNKLQKRTGIPVAALFLTGDIVNQSNTASWAQVEHELSDLGLSSYYVMGNHDNNSIGINVFNKKHGGLYYSFTLQNELYIVLNSIESDRSISPVQLQFLKNVLQNAESTNKRVFIFFHEVIWNSQEKYQMVRSNSRSRYSEIKTVSNFWQKVYPVLAAYPAKNFYLFTGDVGGNPDAISAFYDRWNNVTLLSSGMGEVPDENYMEVNILPDTVMFKLIPLNNAVEMKPITWYSVPEKPLRIEGPAKVSPPQSAASYKVSPVFNATAYKWNFSNGISGTSNSTDIDLRFEPNFQTGQIMARALNDGFGESEPITMEVQSYYYTSASENEMNTKLIIQQNHQSIQIVYHSEKRLHAHFSIYNVSGMLLYQDKLNLDEGLNTKVVDKSLMGKGLVFIELSFENKRLIRKAMLY